MTHTIQIAGVYNTCSVLSNAMGHGKRPEPTNIAVNYGAHCSTAFSIFLCNSERTHVCRRRSVPHLRLGRPRVALLQARVAGVELQVLVIHACCGGVEVAFRLVEARGLQDVGACQEKENRGHGYKQHTRSGRASDSDVMASSIDAGPSYLPPPAPFVSLHLLSFVPSSTIFSTTVPIPTRPRAHLGRPPAVTTQARHKKDSLIMVLLKSRTHWLLSMKPMPPMSAARLYTCSHPAAAATQLGKLRRSVCAKTLQNSCARERGRARDVKRKGRMS